MAVPGLLTPRMSAVISLHSESRALYASTVAAVRKSTGSGPTVNLENGTALQKMHSGMSGSAFARIARTLTIPPDGEEVPSDDVIGHIQTADGTLVFDEDLTSMLARSKEVWSADLGDPDSQGRFHFTVCIAEKPWEDYHRGVVSRRKKRSAVTPLNQVIPSKLAKFDTTPPSSAAGGGTSNKNPQRWITKGEVGEGVNGAKPISNFAKQ